MEGALLLPLHSQEIEAPEDKLDYTAKVQFKTLLLKARSKFATVSKSEHPLSKSLVWAFPCCKRQQSCSALLRIQLAGAVVGSELLPLGRQWRTKTYFWLGPTIS